MIKAAFAIITPAAATFVPDTKYACTWRAPIMRAYISKTPRWYAPRESNVIACGVCVSARSFVAAHANSWGSGREGGNCLVIYWRRTKKFRRFQLQMHKPRHSLSRQYIQIEFYPPWNEIAICGFAWLNYSRQLNGLREVGNCSFLMSSLSLSMRPPSKTF